MEADVRIALPQRRPLGRGLLDAVLAEIALAGSDQGLDFVGRPPFGDRDQRDFARLAARELAGSGDAVADFS